MVICVSGIPGTGKSALSRILSRELRYKNIDVNLLIKRHHLYDYYDRHLKEYVVDTKKLNKYIIKVVKKNNKILIDSHLSHYLPSKYVDLCVITKCSLSKLKQRLEKRKYSEKKIRENLDSEIFDICLNEAKEKKHNVFVINTTRGISKQAITQLLGELNGIKSSGTRAK